MKTRSCYFTAVLISQMAEVQILCNCNKGNIIYLDQLELCGEYFFHAYRVGIESFHLDPRPVHGEGYCWIRCPRYDTLKHTSSAIWVNSLMAMKEPDRCAPRSTICLPIARWKCTPIRRRVSPSPRGAQVGWRACVRPVWTVRLPQARTPR